MPGYDLRMYARPQCRHAAALCRADPDCIGSVARLALSPYPHFINDMERSAMPAYKILIMGACDGPLLASMIMFGGRTNEG
jgi:hypothetical protein